MSNEHSRDQMDRDVIKNMPKDSREALNADPITGEPGAHPIGTGVGAGGGAVVGATVGLVAGPLGALVGGTIGAVVGGLAGSAAGEAIDPTHEEVYWRGAHSSAPYYTDQDNYDRDYASAYRIGYESRSQYGRDSQFEDAEPDMAQRWEAVKGESRLKWADAKHAARQAWNRIS